MAAFSWAMVLQILGGVLGPILNTITPSIKTLLNDFLTDLYRKALATPNPWDDFAVGMLLDILAIPRPLPPA
jgi:hypothetical protein